ncbi:ttm-2 [Pristionchus pacificus]|uniref:Ttm-2 n=1 Tax=Pristionchus pacificus TaxID=54126 RepID=A0A2A6CTQ9_PRIPA|nr:ttm-2 [Pristionchus pacificus]|eukprot:PDM81437.1 ttm-2 [Pristionchus pacificus]
MVTAPRVEVCTEEEVHLPGSQVKGTIRIHSTSAIRGDAIQARFVGRAQAQFDGDCKRRYSNLHTIVDQSQEVWKYRTLGELLGLNEHKDPSEPSSHSISANTRFPFCFRVPDCAPTSLTVPGVPVTIRYSIEFRILDATTVSIYYDHPVVVVRPVCVSRPIAQGRTSHSKAIQLPGDRSILLELSLGKTVMTSADEIDAQITVVNSACEESRRKYRTTNCVGLPAEKQKISVGESYSMKPVHNVPGLNPDADLPHFLKLSHSICLEVGRSKTLVLAKLQVPVTIVTSFVEIAPTKATPKEGKHNFINIFENDTFQIC